MKTGTLLNPNILCHMICLLLIPKTLNLLHYWRNLLWWLALVWHLVLNMFKFLFMINASTCLIGSYSTWYLLFLYLTMAGLPHTMPESDEEVQRQVEEVFGFKPCLWQIHVVHSVLAGKDVITVAPTGSGKSLTYWIPLLYIKHGITVVVSPLKLLGTPKPPKFLAFFK
jgi:hypothetical protein